VWRVAAACANRHFDVSSRSETRRVKPGPTFFENILAGASAKIEIRRVPGAGGAGLNFKIALCKLKLPKLP
jgi:hypothetical protein